MNFMKQSLFTGALCLLLQYFLPWWTLVIGAFLGGYLFGRKGRVSFLAGLLGVGMLWLLTALWIDIQTQSILTEKIARLLLVKNPVLLFLVTALIGGLPGGFAALTGTLVIRLRNGGFSGD
jgi:hypothetical protein